MAKAFIQVTVVEPIGGNFKVMVNVDHIEAFCDHMISFSGKGNSQKVEETGDQIQCLIEEATNYQCSFAELDEEDA